MIDPMHVLHQAAASIEELKTAEELNRVMDDVEFVFEYLEPAHQDLANEVMDHLNQRLHKLGNQ